ADGGEMVLRRIEAMGVKFVTKVGVEDITTESRSEGETFTGFDLSDGTHLESNLVIFAIGIKPRDELAKVSGIETYEKGGIIVGDDLKTSAKDVYAIGDLVEMADILAFNLTQTNTGVGTFKPRQMNNPDLSTNEALRVLLGIPLWWIEIQFINRAMLTEEQTSVLARIKDDYCFYEDTHKYSVSATRLYLETS
ncbi:4375_t:CDS:2, partial [Acaulospora colombiana]